MSPPTSTTSPDAVQARVLNLVDEFVSELRGGSDRRVRPHDSLEQDLGIGSLERVELAVRLEQAFDVRLGDEVMVEADTPADLVSAITTSGPAESSSAAPSQAAPATTAPAAAVTLIDALEWHATRTPERIHIHLREDDGVETPITYGALWEAAVAVANGLAERRVGQRETVAIMLRTEQAFFPTFLGTLLAGCIPVPLYPPVRANRIEEYAERQVGILRNAGARLLITFAEIERLAGVLVPQVPSLTAVVTPDALSAAGGTAGIRYERGARGSDESALIQYTSGSTGNPKGVLLSHANLLANIRAIEEGLGARPDDVGVSWLPLYHDMGLIGSWLGTMYMGVPLVLMSPLAFLARPIRWLRALHDHRGTLSPAPNFAYDLCSQRIRDDELEGLDLSSARRLLNGSEAVHPESLDRFLKRFAPFGLKPEALCPVYGLAECSVALAVPPVERAPRIDAINRQTYQEHGRAEPVDDEAEALRVVSCGSALPRHALRVVDQSGQPVAGRRAGRVQFRGPSATAGYYRNPEATRGLIGADGWLETGDVGYLADGELFVTGRDKDIIIKAGRNLHPHEAEELASGVEGVRKGCVAAFGVGESGAGHGTVRRGRRDAPDSRRRAAADQDRGDEPGYGGAGRPAEPRGARAARGGAQDVQRQDTPGGYTRRLSGGATRQRAARHRRAVDARICPLRAGQLPPVGRPAVEDRLHRIRLAAVAAHRPTRMGAPRGRPAGTLAHAPRRRLDKADPHGHRMPPGRHRTGRVRAAAGGLRGQPRQFSGPGRNHGSPARRHPLRGQGTARALSAGRHDHPQGRTRQARQE